ncbi:MAG: TAT-variant-translocated molybdopterin oxidoreductase [Saprospiraceae bacterium]|nr:TAT-variant-translocated molybdopterin oxidoreductase [Saprospiraceae bacterium]
MKQKNQEVWIGVEQLANDPAYQKLVDSEFAEMPVVEQLAQENAPALNTNRRDFLKFLGFGLGAATIAAGCEIPVRRAIPYVIKPDEIVPGVAVYYASSFVQGGDYCAILVKTREGRPIKIEGNSLSKVTKGATSARAQASVLSLYDTSRVSGPFRIKNGALQQPVKKTESGPNWAEIDKEIMGKLKPESRIRILANTVLSPTTKKAFADFKAKYPNAQVVMYDPVSSAAILQANQNSFSQAVIPSYHFDKAKVIVSFDADFLGTWISPVEYASQYAQNRKVDPKNPTMSRHIQVESHMSLTGSNADNRIMVKPSEQGAAIVALYNELATLLGRARVSGPALDPAKVAKIKEAARELSGAQGSSLVVSGSNNTAEQILVNAINDMLGNYGATISFNEASLQRQGIDKDVQTLIRDMNAGSVDALFVMDGANPAYDLPNSGAFRTGMGKVGLKVSLSGVPNETLLLCDYAAPGHHFLESWGDAEPKRGHYSLIQPVIAPLFNTRQAEESLLRWAAAETLDTTAEQPYFEYLKAHWKQVMFPNQKNFSIFQAFWDSTLHDGVFEAPQSVIATAFSASANEAAAEVRKPSDAELEIVFFETVNMGAGQYANNPWLLEMPDPLARTVWGNYLTIPVSWDGENFKSFKNLNNREIYGKADIVEVEANNFKQRVTAVRQFGQMQGTLGLAIGYGREVTGEVGRALGNKVGADVYPWLSIDAEGNTQYYAVSPAVSDKVATEEEFACVQYHHTMGVTEKNGKTYKDAVTGKNKEVNLDEKVSSRLKDPFNEHGFQGGITERSVIFKGSLNELSELTENIHERRSEAAHLNAQTLYPTQQYTKDIYSQGHWWAMHIDLNACTGCGACQVACVAENNVPVVGKKEVSRHHEMTWLRIDRYFYGDYENPRVVYQPMMCQHCDNAPCENVCPVAATNHSSEGLNQMTYNRCIGTRYCANNCPYKVRRFNWLDYTTADLFGSNEYRVNGEEIPYYADNLVRMVLNPDVTVRSRGVIEKCSFCVQRIQEGKLTAKREGRRLHDADVKSACQTACPTGAITFGDRNNPESAVAQKMDSPLNYLVLEEINVMSSVNYGARVNNSSEKLDA